MPSQSGSKSQVQYVPCPFWTWVIITLHSLFSVVAFSNTSFFMISFCGHLFLQPFVQMCSVGYSMLSSASFAFKYYIFQVFFPYYVSEKFQLSFYCYQ